MKQKRGSIFSLNYFIQALVISFIFLTISVVTDASQSISEVNKIDIHKFFVPGQDAIWLKNPLNPQQKILLVPTMHTRSARLGIQKDLLKTILSGDILVIESAIPTLSWEEGNRFVDLIRRNVNVYHTNIIKDTPFEYFGRPWTTTFQGIYPEEFKYLNNKIEPFLKGFVPIQNRNEVLLSHIHPKFLADVLSKIYSKKTLRMFYGMDYQISKRYQLENKRIYILETSRELKEIYKGDVKHVLDVLKYEHYATLPLLADNTPLFFHQIVSAIKKIETLKHVFEQKTPAELFEWGSDVLAEQYTKEEKRKRDNELEKEIEKDIKETREIIKQMEELGEDPVDVKESLTKQLDELQELREIRELEEEILKLEDSELIARNHLWIPKIKKYINENKEKFIVIIVGADHFSGTEGILQLLQNEGYGLEFFAS